MYHQIVKFLRQGVHQQQCKNKAVVKGAKVAEQHGYNTGNKAVKRTGQRTFG